MITQWDLAYTGLQLTYARYQLWKEAAFHQATKYSLPSLSRLRFYRLHSCGSSKALVIKAAFMEKKACI